MLQNNLKQKAQRKAELTNKIAALDEDISQYQNFQASQITSPKQSLLTKKAYGKKIKDFIIDRKEREQRLLKRQEQIAKEMSEQQEELKAMEKQKELDFIKRVKELHKNKHLQLQQEQQNNEKMIKKCEEEAKKFTGKMPLYLKFEKQFQKKEKNYFAKTPSQSIKKFNYLESKSKIFQQNNQSQQWTPPKYKSQYHQMLENQKSEEYFIKQKRENKRNDQLKLLKQKNYEKFSIDAEKRQAIEERINLDQVHSLNKIKPLQKYEKTYNFREKVYDIKKEEKKNPEIYERNIENNEKQREIGISYLEYSKQNAKYTDQNKSSSMIKKSMEEEKEDQKKKLYEQELKQKNIGNAYMKQTLPKKELIDHIQDKIQKIENSQKYTIDEKKKLKQEQIEKLDMILKQKEDFMTIKGNSVTGKDLSKLDNLLVNNIKAKLQIIQ